MIDLPGLIFRARAAQLAHERHQAALEQATEAEEDDAGRREAEQKNAESREQDER